MLEEVDLRTVRYHKPAGDWHESDFNLSESSDEAEDNKKGIKPIIESDSVKAPPKKRVSKAAQKKVMLKKDNITKSEISSIIQPS